MTDEARRRIEAIDRQIAALSAERDRLVATDASPAPGTRGRSITIIGGDGGMGRLFHRVLTASGYRVSVLERDDDLTTDPRITNSDIVMIAVPMAVAEQVAATVAPRVSEGALLCDINSLKRDICEAMAPAAGEVLGLHPMFGPSVSSFRGQKVVVCDVRSGTLATELVEDIEAAGAEIVRSEPSAHDRMMAVVQVLVHFSTIVMGEALRRTRTEVRESLRFTSPIYRLELAVVGRIFTQDAGLYGEILMSNPYGDEVRRAFVDAARDIGALVDSRERGAFIDEFQLISEWFRDFGAEAMELSDFVIESLVSRG